MFILPSCGKDEDKNEADKKDDSANVAGENGDGNEEKEEEKKDDVKDDGGDSDKGEETPEPAKDPEPEPGDDVPAGGVLKGYYFADGTLEGITPDEFEGNYFDSTWGPGDPTEVKEIGGKNWLWITPAFTGGWELVLYRLPDADLPLMSKASVLKYDLLVPVADIDGAPYVEITPALKTDWGQDWDTKVVFSKSEFLDKATKFNDDFYLFTVNIPYALKDELIIDNGKLYEAWLGIVFNGVTNKSDNHICIGNIEFIK